MAGIFSMILGFPMQGIRGAINLAGLYTHSINLVIIYVINLALTYTGLIIGTGKYGTPHHLV